MKCTSNAPAVPRPVAAGTPFLAAIRPVQGRG